MRLFCDCKTDEEKSNFFLSGRAVETGVIAPANPAVIDELLDCLELAEKERDALRTLVVMRCDLDYLPQFTQGHNLHEFNEPVTAEHCRWFVAEIERLRAKIAEMEKQEPVAWISAGGDVARSKAFMDEMGFACAPLYLAHGAKPAPIIPEGWKPIPEKHPTFDLVDLRLADGSVLCGCLPQWNGDYWWKGPNGEVFIDPKYASVTHWRPASEPKPEDE